MSNPISTFHLPCLRFTQPPCHRTPPPLSPISDNWASSVTASPVLRPPPPPPPSPPPPPPLLASCSWEFWDLFAPSSTHSVTEEEWEEAATSISSANAIPPEVVSGFPKDPSVELAVVSVSRGKKNFSEIVDELNEYFSKASETGKRVSLVLETPICDPASPKRGISGKMSVYCKNFSPLIRPWSSSPKASALASLRESGEGMSRVSHSCTVEKLYAWEKKLYLEVKNCERSRVEKEKRLSLLRRQEANGVDYFKIEKNKREIERLESQLMVYCQAIESTSSEIAKLREEELFPQLLDLASGLMSMWRGMYECHQVQTHIVQQLQHLNSSNPSSTFPTSELHRHYTQQLEAEIDNWHSAFCSLIKSQRDYIHAITGWLRLSHFQCQHGYRNRQNSQIYLLCEEWQLALDRVPDKVASDGIKSFSTMIRTVVAQQAEEHKHKKRSDSTFKELEKRSKELRSREEKFEALKLKAEEERVKYEKNCGITRAMTLNNLQTGLPNLFQSMTGFSSVCTQAFSEVCNPQTKSNIAVNFDRMLPP